MDDMTKMIEKIRRRPRLMIDTSDIDTHDRVAMGTMFNTMRKIIGMFYVRNFVVRVETAFDNTQIRSEHHAMSRLGLEHIGVDHANHVVVPVHVQLSSIENVPPSVRTPFHHISYSIQPMVQHSRTLDSWHRHARPTRTAIMALCKQMAEALVHLHAHNVVHGDIKPGNTLVKGAELYVIDFGMSGAHDDSEGTGGTKPYCAPETGNGSSNDAESYHWTQNRMENDVWSFGLMFFTMLALRRCIYHPNEYPAGFFNCDGFVNASHFDNIRERALFQRILCPRETRYTAAECLHAINELELELEQEQQQLEQLDELDDQLD
jgi:serine/threonine protein kinase